MNVRARDKNQFFAKKKVVTYEKNGPSGLPRRRSHFARRRGQTSRRILKVCCLRMNVTSLYWLFNKKIKNHICIQNLFRKVIELQKLVITLLSHIHITHRNLLCVTVVILILSIRVFFVELNRMVFLQWHVLIKTDRYVYYQNIMTIWHKPKPNKPLTLVPQNNRIHVFFHKYYRSDFGYHQ